MFDVDADSRDDCVEVFVAAGAGLGGRFPVGGMGAVDEDEVPLLNRLGESTRKEEQDRFKEDSDTSPDPEDRGLTDSQEVDDHHLGQVLTKDQQTRHPLTPQGIQHLNRSIPRPSITSATRQVISSIVSSQNPVVDW